MQMGRDSKGDQGPAPEQQKLPAEVVQSAEPSCQEGPLF